MSTPAAVGPVARSLAILEVVADRGGAGAKEIADALGLALPTVYRLAKDLIESDYLVHIRHERRYELGHKLHQLGLSLHRQLGLSRPVTAEIARLHTSTGFAAYLAVLRGAELVLVQVVDSRDCPRLQPLRFGFHEVPHATAFGKILLAEWGPEARDGYLARHGLRALTARTTTERDRLARTAGRGTAWHRLGTRGVPGGLGVCSSAGARSRCRVHRSGCRLGPTVKFRFPGARHRDPSASGRLQAGSPDPRFSHLMRTPLSHRRRHSYGASGPQRRGPCSRRHQVTGTPPQDDVELQRETAPGGRQIRPSVTAPRENSPTSRL